MQHPTNSPKVSVVAVLPIIGIAAFCALLPFFWFGIPSGHDFEFHFNSWLEVLAQWRQGIVYPHWSAFAHFGYGEVRFIFYPPISWTLGSALGAILPWKFVPFAYNWIALTLSGISMFILARQWVSRRDSMFAAAFYVVNPYFLVIVYYRSAMAELLAGAYIPLLFMYGLQLGDDGFRAIVPLSLLISVGWLTNIPSAIMMVYSLGLLALWPTISRKSWKPLFCALASVALGVAVAGIYLVPVLHQRAEVALDQVLSPGVRPLDNFLFITTTDAEHDRFNHIASIVAVCEIVILGITLWLARRKDTRKLWVPLLLWGSLCTVLMLRLTLPLWNHLPELRYIQFPWRWLLVMNVALVLPVTVAFRHWWLRILVCAIALSSFIVGWHSIQPPWWDNAGDIKEMIDNQQDGIGNDGTDEYLPISADSDVNQNAPLAAYVGNGSAKISVETWQAEHRVIEADASVPGNLVLRLFNYLLWKVKVNGRLVRTQNAEGGEITIPVATGENHIEIRWIEGWDRKVGGLISLCGLAIVLALFTKRRPRYQDAS